MIPAMRAVQVTKAGGPDVLEVVDVDDPAPGPGEVLVDVAAAGVNYIDTYQREGIYPMETPYVAGMEGAGRVAALGDGVEGVAVGDRIAWAETLGSYAERVAVPWAKAVPVPDGVDDEQAVGALLQGMTAHFLVTDTYPVRSGDTVLVHAAAGGVGLLLVQLATAKGARVIATVSTAEKEELARAAGAAEVIRYTEVDDLAAEVRSLTGGEGVAAAFDSVGKTTFDASLASLRRRGMLVLFGAASGPVPPVDPQRLNSAGLGVPDPAEAVRLRDHHRGAALACGGRVRRRRRRHAGRADRAPLPARGGPRLARGSAGAPHDGQAAAHTLSTVAWAGAKKPR